jgi:hypothetical protein
MRNLLRQALVMDDDSESDEDGGSPNDGGSPLSSLSWERKMGVQGEGRLIEVTFPPPSPIGLGKEFPEDRWIPVTPLWVTIDKIDEREESGGEGEPDGATLPPAPCIQGVESVGGPVGPTLMPVHSSVVKIGGSGGEKPHEVVSPTVSAERGGLGGGVKAAGATPLLTFPVEEAGSQKVGSLRVFLQVERFSILGVTKGGRSSGREKPD